MGRRYKATVGLNGTLQTITVAKYRKGEDQFTLWDLGGRVNLRKIWESYYSECHGIVFLIGDRYVEGLQILSTIALT